MQPSTAPDAEPQHPVPAVAATGGPATEVAAPTPSSKAGARVSPAAPARRVSKGEVVREKAAPFDAQVELDKKSLNFAPQVLDAAEQWLRAQRTQHRRPMLSWLVDAALHDLPCDVNELRALGQPWLPGPSPAPPLQVGLRLPRTTIERIEDAQFEITASRHQKSVVLWHALTGALARQLEVEGFPVAGPTG